MAGQAPIIHLGLQKTATTLLQRALFADETRFFTPWGNPAGEAIEHFVLAHPDRLDIAGLRESATPPAGRVTVISQEDILGYPVLGRYHAETSLARIATIFPEARLLLGIREQRAMLFSQYYQYVRQGGTRRFAELLQPEAERTGIRSHFRLEHFRYDDLVALVHRHFPPDRLTVLPYEMLRADPAGYAARLSAALGVEAPPEIAADVVRGRMGGVGLALKRRLNALVPDPALPARDYADLPVAVRARNRLVRLVDGALSDVAGLGELVDGRVRAEIEARTGTGFDASNARTAALIGVDLAALGYRTGRQEARP